MKKWLWIVMIGIGLSQVSAEDESAGSDVAGTPVQGFSERTPLNPDMRGYFNENPEVWKAWSRENQQWRGLPYEEREKKRLDWLQKYPDLKSLYQGRQRGMKRVRKGKQGSSCGLVNGRMGDGPGLRRRLRASQADRVCANPCPMRNRRGRGLGYGRRNTSQSLQ